MAWLGETATTSYAKSCEADAKNGKGRRLWHRRYGCRQETVDGAVPKNKNPDDLPRVVDAEGHCFGRAGHVDLGEAPAAVEIAVAAPTHDLVKITDDLAPVVDAGGQRLERAGHIDLGEAPAAVEIAVRDTHAVAKGTDDLPRVVDAEGIKSSGRAGHIDLGEAPPGIEKAVFPPRAVDKLPDDLPASLMPKARVSRAPGTSIWVKPKAVAFAGELTASEAIVRIVPAMDLKNTMFLALTSIACLPECILSIL
jgi:hypothetical protein